MLAFIRLILAILFSFGTHICNEKFLRKCCAVFVGSFLFVVLLLFLGIAAMLGPMLYTSNSLYDVMFTLAGAAYMYVELKSNILPNMLFHWELVVKEFRTTAH
jgi:hypothetical protein